MSFEQNANEFMQQSQWFHHHSLIDLYNDNAFPDECNHYAFSSIVIWKTQSTIGFITLIEAAKK